MLIGSLVGLTGHDRASFDFMVFLHLSALLVVYYLSFARLGCTVCLFSLIRLVAFGCCVLWCALFEVVLDLVVVCSCACRLASNARQLDRLEPSKMRPVGLRTTLVVDQALVQNPPI